MLSFDMFLSRFERTFIGTLARTAWGRELLRHDIWWNASSISLRTALLATRGNPDLPGAYSASPALAKELVQWIPPHATVMEFGCGIGLNMLALADACTSIVGIEKSKGLLRLGRKLARNVKNVSFLWYDGGRLPVKSEIFDFAFEVGVFERIDKSQVSYYISEIRRCLKHEGFAYLFFLSNRAAGTEFTRKLGDDSYYFFTDDEALHAVSASGMKVIRTIKKPKAVIIVAERFS